MSDYVEVNFSFQSSLKAGTQYFLCEIKGKGCERKPMYFNHHALLGCVRNQMIVSDVIPTGILLYFRSSVALRLAGLQAFRKLSSLPQEVDSQLQEKQLSHKKAQRLKYLEACQELRRNEMLINVRLSIIESLGPLYTQLSKRTSKCSSFYTSRCFKTRG